MKDGPNSVIETKLLLNNGSINSISVTTGSFLSVSDSTELNAVARSKALLYLRAKKST